MFRSREPAAVLEPQDRSAQGSIREIHPRRLAPPHTLRPNNPDNFTSGGNSIPYPPVLRWIVSGARSAIPCSECRPATSTTSTRCGDFIHRTDSTTCRASPPSERIDSAEPEATSPPRFRRSFRQRAHGEGDGSAYGLLMSLDDGWPVLLQLGRPLRDTGLGEVVLSVLIDGEPAELLINDSE